MAADGTLVIDSRIDPKGFNTGLKGINGALAGIGKYIGVAFSVAAIVSFVKKTISLATELQGIQRRFNTIFGSSAPEMRKSLEELGVATNSCEDDLMSLATAMDVAFKGMGFAGDKAADLSLNVTKMGQDLALFWGKDTTAVIGDLQYAMMGFYRGLRQYGIILNETQVKEKARSMGLWDGVGAINAQAKAQATLAIISQQTAYATGYAVASTTTWVGKIRGITVAWEDFCKILGSAFMTALQGLLPAIQWFMDILVRVATTFNQLMGILFGIRVAIPTVGDGLEGAAAGAQDLADSTNAAGKAAKGALASFDELNVLQQDKGTGAGAVPDFSVGAATMQQDYAQSIGWVQSHWQTLVEDFQLGQDIIKKLMEYPLFQKWSDFMVQIGLMLWDLVHLDFDGAWEHAKLAFQAAIDFWKYVFEGFWIWLEPIMANIAQTVIEWIHNAWNNAGDFLNSWWGWLGQLINTALGGIGNFFNNFWIFVKQKATDAWNAIALAWNGAVLWFQTVVIDPLKKAFTTALDNIRLGWENIFTGITTFVKGQINLIIGFLNSMIAAIIAGINAATAALNNIKVTMPSWLPAPYGGSVWSLNLPTVSGVTIPYLASGAVIPPNSKFAAVLGDQSRGNNLEAPEDLIRQIVREETANNNVVIRFEEGNLSALWRILKPYATKEDHRVGPSFVVGTSI